MDYSNPHIVRTINMHSGKAPVEVRFADDSYQGVPPEEIQRRTEHMRAIAGRILARRRMETAG